MFGWFKKKEKKKTSKYTIGVDSASTPDNTFIESVAIGYALDDGLVGGLLGGDICGGIVGDMLNTDDSSSSYDISSCESSDSSCDFGD